MDEPYCDQYDRYYDDFCGDGKYTGWVHHNILLSLGLDLIIVATVLGFIWWFIWWKFFYTKRPLCAFCKKDGTQTRVKGGRTYDGQPACYEHQIEQRQLAAQRRAGSEPVYDCPISHDHGRMAKHVVRVNDDFIVVDRCAEGCQLTQANETAALEEQVRARAYNQGRDDGRSSGMAMGIAIGVGASAGR
jgi:hypothetical protein